jgi:hypothetical protein
MKAIWDLLPGWLRTSILILFFVFYTPWWVREQVITFVDSRVHATITPLKDARDAEIALMKFELHETHEGVKEIRNHLLGPK